MSPGRGECTGMLGPGREAANTSLPSSLANSIHQLRELIQVTFSCLGHLSYFLLYKFLKDSKLTFLMKSSFLHSQQTQGWLALLWEKSRKCPPCPLHAREQDTTPTESGPHVTSITLFTWITFLVVPSPNTATGRVRTSAHKFWRLTYSQSITITFSFTLRGYMLKASFTNSPINKSKCPIKRQIGWHKRNIYACPCKSSFPTTRAHVVISFRLVP